jgi:zinc D-Ala-D-Ala carboxypeptidase
MWFDDIFLSWFNKQTAAPIQPIIKEKIVNPAIIIGTDYQLSKNYTYGMLVTTEHRNYISQNFDEGKKYIDNMRILCNTILEPVGGLIGIIPHINSCFRCPGLNKIVNGSITSQHMIAEAGDTVYDKMSLREVFNKIANSNIPFSQLIFEYSSWIHIGMLDLINHPNKIGQKFITKIENGKTEYITVDKL